MRLAAGPKTRPSSCRGCGAGVAAGVETDTVWVLQRGARVWDQATFVSAADHHVSDSTHIPEAAVLQLDKDSGKVLR